MGSPAGVCNASVVVQKVTFPNVFLCQLALGLSLQSVDVAGRLDDHGIADSWLLEIAVQSVALPCCEAYAVVQVHGIVSGTLHGRYRCSSSCRGLVDADSRAVIPEEDKEISSWGVHSANRDTSEVWALTRDTLDALSR